MIDFTVAICTYNSEQLLPNMFEKLKEQVDTENITWEIIVIDNNSRDNTAKIVQEYENTNWAKVSSIKYYFEPEQGRAFARHRAIKEAQAELIGFL
jgi:glycosyltransferase involved in cell wall biosynthesis